MACGGSSIPSLPGLNRSRNELPSPSLSPGNGEGMGRVAESRGFIIGLDGSRPIGVNIPAAGDVEKFV